MEELLHLHKPLLRDFDVDVSIAYSEKSGRLELVVETEDTPEETPLDAPTTDDDFAAAIVRVTAETIEHRRENGRSRLTLAVRTNAPVQPA